MTPTPTPTVLSLETLAAQIAAIERRYIVEQRASDERVKLLRRELAAAKGAIDALRQWAAA